MATEFWILCGDTNMINVTNSVSNPYVVKSPETHKDLFYVAWLTHPVKAHIMNNAWEVNMSLIREHSDKWVMSPSCLCLLFSREICSFAHCHTYSVPSGHFCAIRCLHLTFAAFCTYLNVFLSVQMSLFLHYGDSLYIAHGMLYTQVVTVIILVCM